MPLKPPPADPTALKRLTQEALNEVIKRHELFNRNRTGGQRANLSRHDLTGLRFALRDLSHADFTASVLQDADLKGCKLDYCVFFAADLRSADFRDASLIRADLRGATLRGAIMSNADLTNADLREGAYARFDNEKGYSYASEGEGWKEGPGNVDLRGAILTSAKMSGAVATNSNFEDADLSKVVFSRGNLTGANLTGANLSGADLSNCIVKDVVLRGANLVGVKMDVSGLEGVDMTGAFTDAPMGKTLDQLPMGLDAMAASHKTWIETKAEKGARLDLSNFDMRKAPVLRRTDLTMLVAEGSVWYGYDFSRMNIQAARFREADMRDCIFDYTDLRGANFAKAHLVSAKFTNARLEPLIIGEGRTLKADFRGANLRYADLSNANLRDAVFADADLSYANLLGATLDGADFTNAILDKTNIGLTNSVLPSMPKDYKEDPAS